MYYYKKILEDIKNGKKIDDFEIHECTNSYHIKNTGGYSDIIGECIPITKNRENDDYFWVDERNQLLDIIEDYYKTKNIF